MWSVNTLTLVDFLEPGDVIQHEGVVYTVQSAYFREEHDELWEIQGIDDEWEEPHTFFIPDGHMVELMYWSSDD